MEYKCLHCGGAFTAKRSTKKYCSDNCKQMAYFNRKGIVFGLGNLSLNRNFEEDSIKQTEVKLQNPDLSVKLNFTVKQEEEKHSLTDITVKSEDEIDTTERFIVKDDQITVKPEFSVKEKIRVKYDKPIDTTTDQQNNSGELVDSTTTKMLPKDLTSLEKTQTIPDQKYEWIPSKFYTEIEDFNEQNEGVIDYSSRNENTNWVNVRLRCIIENAIRLNEYAFVDRDSILVLKEALSSVIQSNTFRNIPTHYPYREVIQELFERLHQLLKNRAEQISLRYSFTLKARLVSMQNTLKEMVPKIKFDELDFTEAQSHHFIQGVNSNKAIKSSKHKTQQSANWQERYKQYVREGLIDADENIDDENNEEQDEGFDEESNNNRLNHYSERLKHFKRTGKFPESRKAA